MGVVKAEQSGDYMAFNLYYDVWMCIDELMDGNA